MQPAKQRAAPLARGIEESPEENATDRCLAQSCTACSEKAVYAPIQRRYVCIVLAVELYLPRRLVDLKIMILITSSQLV